MHRHRGHSQKAIFVQEQTTPCGWQPWLASQGFEQATMFYISNLL